jgi:hypothetical protein
MLRTALIAVLLLTGLASTALASDRDRVRVVVSFDSGGYGYYHAGDRYYSGRDRGYSRDYRGYSRDYRRDGRRYDHDRRWDRGRYSGRNYGWSPRYYYSPRSYSYYGSGRYRDSYYGHSRHCPDRWHRH